MAPTLWHSCARCLPPPPPSGASLPLPLLLPAVPTPRSCLPPPPAASPHATPIRAPPRARIPAPTMRGPREALHRLGRSCPLQRPWLPQGRRPPPLPSLWLPSTAAPRAVQRRHRLQQSVLSRPSP